MNSAQLNKIATTTLLGLFFMFTPKEIKAQDNLKEKPAILVEETEGPIMFKFEPNFLSAEEQRKEDIKLARAVIDTMTISDRKRKRLLKDLYKNGVSERLSKVLLVETKFEDIEEDEE